MDGIKVGTHAGAFVYGVYVQPLQFVTLAVFDVELHLVQFGDSLTGVEQIAVIMSHSSLPG